MELVLIRTYHPMGTNGIIFNGAQHVCRTIELPWRNNAKQISCIPEGRYEVKDRYSKKYGSHLILHGVKGRSYILIHPANNAMKELRGCIAPVTDHSAPGKGTQSRIAMARLQNVYYGCLGRAEPLFLTIRS